MKFGVTIVDKDSLTVFVDGSPYQADSSHKNYDKLKKAVLEENVKDFLRYIDVSKTIQKSVSKVTKDIEVRNGAVYYKGEVLHNELTRRIVELVEGGYSCKAMVAFLENLMQNPSHQSIVQLYQFLQHRNLPITEDGYFLGYKGVTNDYKDCHTQKFDNSVGAKNSMPRNRVNDNRNVGCSTGFHVGSLSYATGFGPKTVVVKVNPKDAVSVPTDSNEQKLRVCEYEVVGEYTGPLEEPVYKTKGVIPSDYEDDDYDDEDSVLFYDEEEDGDEEEELELVQLDDGKDLEAGELYVGQELNFDYKKTMFAPTSRRRHIEVTHVQDDRFVGRENGEYKTFIFTKMSNIQEV